jgi:hypothetical protein
MKITAILSTHGLPEITMDTLDSIRHYMTDEVLLLVDGVGWDKFENLEVPAYKLKGFNHGWYKSPYRNIVLGLYAASQFKSDWYCYIEYDCLVGSSAFKKDLEEAEKAGDWLVGCDLRRNQTVDLSFLELIVGEKFEEKIYFLGACLFYHRKFIEKAIEKRFFEKFLQYTNDFRRDFFPNFGEWDLTEFALPTVVKHYGGGVKELSAYNQKLAVWGGNYRRYPIRFRPELPYEKDYFLQASIMHPIKDVGHPIRKYHKTKRLKNKVDKAKV